jgi:hypothetical protein
MRVTALEIRHNERDGQHTLGLDMGVRDALATYCRLRWPTGTAKLIAREWGLSLDEARGIVAGNASLATIDKIWKHRNGGWSVAFEVIGAVTGQSVADYLKTQRRNDEEEARRSRALDRHFRPGLGLRVRIRPSVDSRSDQQGRADGLRVERPAHHGARSQGEG